jgi:hypothetical protein
LPSLPIGPLGTDCGAAPVSLVCANTPADPHIIKPASPSDKTTRFLIDLSWRNEWRSAFLKILKHKTDQKMFEDGRSSSDLLLPSRGMADIFHPSSEPTFADLYRPMSELELGELAADWHSLIDEARAALKAEFASRNLEFVEPPLPVDEPVEYRDLVTLCRYRDLSEAIVARAVVESAGIFCFLKDENLVRLDWQMSNLVGGIRLQVGAADVEAAEAVLSQPVPDSIEIPDQPDFEQPRCPRCNSTDIAWERQGRKAALLSLYLFSLPSPRGPASWRCSNCGLHWADEDESMQATSNNLNNS